MTQVRVNIRALVNASKIRHETRDGRKVVVVPSATLPDNIVMNGIRYPAAVIAESFHTLEGTLAPLGHPMVNGKFVSAGSPAGLAQGYIGAHNENVRRENGRVFLDKVIDVDVANRSEGGKAILSAIDKQEPIATSTGLLATLKPLTNAEDGAKFEAETMLFDHDCIEPAGGPAATPEQGVGIFVNSAGEKIDVINSSLEDDIEREQVWALESLLRTTERKEQIPLLKRILSLITDVVRGEPEPASLANQETAVMDQAQFDALSAKVDALANAKQLTAEDIATIVANAVKPITERQEAADKAVSDKAEADRLVLVNQVVEADILTADEAKDVPAAALTKMLANAAGPKPAFRVNSAFTPTQGGEPLLPKE